MQIALVSLNPLWENKEANKQRCKRFIQRAAKEDCALAIFPEMTLTGFSNNTQELAEDAHNGPTSRWFSNIGRENNLGIIYGQIVKQTAESTQLPGARAQNALVYNDRTGAQQALYKKIHPFSYVNEHQFYQAGDQIVKTRIGSFDVGFTICYDLRFPELYSALANHCMAIVNIANWPQRRLEHWQILLQARAIESQCYIIGVNRMGIDDHNIAYQESTYVFSPFGKRCQPTLQWNEDAGTGFIYSLDRKLVDSSRQQFPFRQDRRTDLYKTII